MIHVLTFFCGLLYGGSVLAQAPQPAATPGFNWGEIVDGMQLGTLLDESNGIVHCRIRNATSNDMSYFSFDPGYFEYVRFEREEGTNWEKLQFAMPGLHTAVGGMPRTLKQLKAGEVIDKMSSFRPFIAPSYEEYLQAYRGDTNEARKVEALNQRWAAREKLIQSLSRGDTFALDLIEQSWPTNLPVGPAERVRVRQEFHGGDGSRMDALYSPVFSIGNNCLPAFEKQRAELFGTQP